MEPVSKQPKTNVVVDRYVFNAWFPAHIPILSSSVSWSWREVMSDFDLLNSITHIMYIYLQRQQNIKYQNH